METTTVSIVNMARGAAVSNSHGVKLCTKMASLLDSQRQNTQRNKEILNLNSASIKYIIFVMKAEIILKR